MNIPLMSAADARSRMGGNKRLEQKVTIYKLKDDLDRAIKTAINARMAQATVRLPYDIEPALLKGIRRAIEKLGYETRVRIEEGEMAFGVYRPPYTTLTVAWGGNF